MNIKNKISFLYLILVVVTMISCSIASTTVKVSKRINKKVVIGSDFYYNGVWYTAHGPGILDDQTLPDTHRYLIYEIPVEYASYKNFIIFYKI